MTSQADYKDREFIAVIGDEVRSDNSRTRSTGSYDWILRIQ
jgi:hypothetical protein